MMADDPVFNHLPIALVGPLPPPSGGMANQTRQLARLLQESGLHVELVQVNSPYRPAWISLIPMVRAIFRLAPYLVQLWQVAGRVNLMHVMANSGWSWHLFVTPAVWVGWLRRVPIVINYRGGEAEAFFSRAWRWVRPAIVKADLVAVPSGFLEAIFAQRGIKTEIVPNIIDLQCFYPSEVQYELQFHLLVARNLEPIYDIATALKAFALLKKYFPSTKLSVAGSGPLRANLEQLAIDLGISDMVTFTGRLDNRQMAVLYRNANLLLNPSLADNMPISLLEALACGVPIVSTNVGGIPYLVEHERTALLVNPNDDSAMAAAAIRILSDPTLAAALRAAGLAEVQNYTWKKVRERLFSVYAKVLIDKTIVKRR